MNATMGLSWDSRTAPALGPWLAAPVLLAAALFFGDLQAPDLMFHGVPYLLVVGLAQYFAGAQAAAVAGVASGVLIFAAPVLGSANAAADPLWVSFLGRITVVGSMAFMVLFIRQRDLARADLREHADVVESSASVRSDHSRLVNVQLHREIAERRRAELRSGYLASIVETSADAIIGQSSDGLIMSWNAGASHMYGHERANVIGQPSSMLVPPEYEEEMTSLLARVCAGERVDEVESIRLRLDGTMFDVSASFSPILDERGAIVGVSVIERDITRRMHAEEALQSLNAELEAKVQQRTQELEVAVGELEAFSYSVSHDLRAPLRALRGFAEALTEDAAERLLEPERDLLSRIRNGAVRMDRIIDDLMMLAQSGNDAVEYEVVNLGEIAASVIEDLKVAFPDRKVEWEIGDGMLAWGDAGLLRLVVQNLIGNAFKYTEQRELAHVSVGVESRGDGTVTYFVRDDGAGFDPELAGNLFRPFSRLHRNEEFEGSGIGLATVARIVHRHGGEVSADGHKGEGAVFRFRLPVPKRELTADEQDYLVYQSS